MPHTKVGQWLRVSKKVGPPPSAIRSNYLFELFLFLHVPTILVAFWDLFLELSQPFIRTKLCFLTYERPNSQWSKLETIVLLQIVETYISCMHLLLCFRMASYYILTISFLFYNCYIGSLIGSIWLKVLCLTRKWVLSSRWDDYKTICSRIVIFSWKKRQEMLKKVCYQEQRWYSSLVSFHRTNFSVPC
jgi:hypothetical protein